MWLNTALNGNVSSRKMLNLAIQKERNILWMSDLGWTNSKKICETDARVHLRHNPVLKEEFLLPDVRCIGTHICTVMCLVTDAWPHRVWRWNPRTKTSRRERKTFETGKKKKSQFHNCSSVLGFIQQPRWSSEPASSWFDMNAGE